MGCSVFWVLLSKLESLYSETWQLVGVVSTGDVGSILQQINTRCFHLEIIYYLKLVEISDELTRKYLINDAADTIVASRDKVALWRSKITPDPRCPIPDARYPVPREMDVLSWHDARSRIG